jgi:uncharacterized membrane protein
MTEERMQRIVGTLLQVGVLLSALVVAAGGAWWLERSGHSVAAYRQFRSEPDYLRSVSRLVRAASRPRPEVLIQLGLVILIATPVARVAFSIVAFALQRDHKYVWITLIVLAVLLYSLAFPHG